MPGSRTPCARLPAQSLAGPFHQWRGPMQQLSEEAPAKSQLPWGLRQDDSQLMGVLEAEGQPNWTLFLAISLTPEQALPGQHFLQAIPKLEPLPRPEEERHAQPARRTLSPGDLPPLQHSTNTVPTEIPFPGKEATPTPMK